MKKNNLKSLYSNISQKIKAYKKKYPKKFKYFLISASGVVVISLAAVTASSLHMADKLTAEPPSQAAAGNSTYTSGDSSVLAADQAAKVTADGLSQNTTALSDSVSGKVSRGEKALLDPSKGDIISLGIKNTIVTLIQQRLVELDYLESDEPTQEYSEAIEAAVKLFQRKHELDITGQVDARTYDLLMSDAAKEYTVYLGAEGTDVEQLQNRLYELGYLNKVTGYFGTDTEDAVKEFQKRNGLSEDGNVGKNTREKLYSADAIPLSFYIGDENDEILKFQQRLYELGYLTSKPDSKYGTDTVMAVKHFQDINGLIADGYMGPATRDLLMSGNAQEYCLKTGDRGDDVENIQTYLKKLKYLKSVTGYFGSDTHDAVINFQKRNGLTADGKVGSQTIRKLLSDSAKSWNGSALGGGSESGSGSSGSGSGNSGGGSSGDSDSGISSGSIVNRIISIAKSKLGSRYVYGAKGPNTFDCSGFVYWVLNQAGIKQSYMTSYSWQNTSRYQRISSMKDIRKGDIISYRGHVGIALGNGQMIDASSSQGKVRITSINSSYWINHFEGAYRIF
ncbi:peptidoglycan endopeptidase LytF precursor [Ruminiclostridium hungatei]|uniref:Peptidoglycan endopeptidase LytF n=1 Tax=Ruminiclostridium hungatei TaxID=48256 RepID=A0A1V4SGD3_RUMHU|nr:peptidoglycan-binding protein [Ruminiclostridium hungatei]OPX42793.1 peptidoglycan endopeptidase LytF precursor [Ruminiclostridium hungatei]